MSNDAPEGAGTHLDAAIDRAVREMLDVEPAANLRGRIVEQIGRPRAFVGRGFRPGLRWTWVVAPVAVVALLVIAIVLMRSAAPVAPQRETGTVVRAPYVPPQPAPTLAQREQPRRPTPERTAPPHDRRAQATAALPDQTIFSSRTPDGFAVVDALPPPRPLVVNTIAAPDSTQPADLEITPLRVAPLELHALPETPQERQE